MFYQNDGFGKSGKDGVVAALARHKLKPIAEGSVERNSLQVETAVAQIARSNPQAVIMVTLYKPTAEFIRQMRKAGLNLIGRTTTPEFGVCSSAENPAVYVTRNPWNTAFPTCGSSAGCAAVVAAGVLPLSGRGVIALA